jgi:hypothetical protein
MKINLTLRGALYNRWLALRAAFRRARQHRSIPDGDADDIHAMDQRPGTGGCRN